MTTGIVVPMSFAVWALNALTNSMMLMPCWPSAGPTGGAGEAWPPGACSLMVVRTFFAMGYRFRLPGSRACGRAASEVSGSAREPSATLHALDLLDLVVTDLDRRLAAEDRHQHLQLRGVLVDLGDLAREVGQRAGDDLDGLADRELRARRGADRHLAVQQPVDLGLGQRDRLVGSADEAGHARRALDHLPGVLVEVHVHQHVAGHGALLDRDLLVVLHLLDGLGRDDNLAHRARLVERGDTVLEVLLDLLLVPRVGVDDVPAEHLSPALQDGFDERLPERVVQPEVAARDHDEAEHDGRRLADLTAVRPLHAAQLVDAVAKEGEQAPALAPWMLRLRDVAGGDGVALDGVGSALELVLVDPRAVVALTDVGQRAGLGQARLVDLGGGMVERIGSSSRPARCTALLGALAIAGHPATPS